MPSGCIVVDIRMPAPGHLNTTTRHSNTWLKQSQYIVMRYQYIFNVHPAVAAGSGTGGGDTMYMTCE
eukprot:659002-Karenia_brevis.AAC.1